MRHHNSLLHDLLKFIPWSRFDQLVKKHGSDKGVRKLTTKTQFVTLLHAQLGGNDSLRAITTTMASHHTRLYHLGLAQAPQRSTLADANNKRSAALYADLFAVLVPQLTRGQQRKFGSCVQLLDASTLPLHGLSKAWARDKKRDGAAAKMHVAFDLDSGVPVEFDVSNVRTNDIAFAKAVLPASGTTYVFDLGYYCFALWRRLDDNDCRFVTRLKSHTKPKVIAERAVPSNSSVIADRDIQIAHRMTSNRKNPLQEVRLREVVVVIDTGKQLRLVTNDSEASAETIAELYKARWQIELFFKWMKQNLRIRRFIGTSENAVRTQIAVAMIAFVLMKLAHGAQTSIVRMIDFMRLVRAHLMTNRTIKTLAFHPPDDRNSRQVELQLC